MAGRAEGPSELGPRRPAPEGGFQKTSLAFRSVSQFLEECGR